MIRWLVRSAIKICNTLKQKSIKEVECKYDFKETKM